MQSSDEPTLQLLNLLVQVTKDAEQGYQAAALDVADADLARLFADYAAQRMKFVVELQQRVKLLRGEPPKEGSLAGKLHRGWLGLEAALSAGDAYVVLAECERADALALDIYREGLQLRDMDDDSRRLVQRHYEAVQAAHDRVKQLRDRAEVK